MNDTIFVTGASGHLGRLVIQHLLARGVTPARLIAGTRSPEKLADLAAAGIAVRKADFEDRQGLTEAFDGVGTVLVISTDALEEAGARLKQHRNAVASAAAAGVGRLAYTSQFNPASSLLSCQFAAELRERSPGNRASHPGQRPAARHFPQRLVSREPVDVAAHRAEARPMAFGGARRQNLLRGTRRHRRSDCRRAGRLGHR
ncbi:NAD(P)H-binding protein [Burkholderia gladioli]|uniref:NAD(P)H-binding protein n=1 Tax=Burkholderia gladioli TaxID=28095 RepID=UPI001FC82C51|nr:NAD(P)H-binding protein [Burkholderia gladioli]